MSNLVAIAALTGFVGDGLLQIIARTTPYEWGLRGYFDQHGSAEALFIAAGMLAMFFTILLAFPFIPVNFLTLAVYGALLDILFRLTGIFPSLDGYYRSLNPVESIIWGAIPMMLPLLFAKIFWP
jgi:hypothetical protein